MLTRSVPKLLQEAKEVKEALEKIGDDLPDAISVAALEARITALEAKVSELDGLNADRTRVVNEKGDMAEDLSDQLVRTRSGIKGLYGNDSSEYEMVGGTRASERKKPKRKEAEE